MQQYPATVIALDPERTVVRIDATGHVIKFDHDAHNAVPASLREVGARGVISFPKVPPQFSDAA